MAYLCRHTPVALTAWALDGKVNNVNSVGLLPSTTRLNSSSVQGLGRYVTRMNAESGG
jgi:hypothetical protein